MIELYIKKFEFHSTSSNIYRNTIKLIRYYPVGNKFTHEGYLINMLLKYYHIKEVKSTQLFIYKKLSGLSNINVPQQYGSPISMENGDPYEGSYEDDYTKNWESVIDNQEFYSSERGYFFKFIEYIPQTKLQTYLKKTDDTNIFERFFLFETKLPFEKYIPKKINDINNFQLYLGDNFEFLRQIFKNLQYIEELEIYLYQLLFIYKKLLVVRKNSILRHTHQTFKNLQIIFEKISFKLIKKLKTIDKSKSKSKSESNRMILPFNENINKLPKNKMQLNNFYLNDLKELKKIIKNILLQLPKLKDKYNNGNAILFFEILEKILINQENNTSKIRYFWYYIQFFSFLSNFGNDNEISSIIKVTLKTYTDEEGFNQIKRELNLLKLKLNELKSDKKMFKLLNKRILGKRKKRSKIRKEEAIYLKDKGILSTEWFEKLERPRKKRKTKTQNIKLMNSDSDSDSDSDFDYDYNI